MQTCWDCATNVWVSFARPASSLDSDDGTGGKDRNSGPFLSQSGVSSANQPTNQQPRIQMMRPPISKMFTETKMVDDNDSGNYSGM